jgi:hypothetical protein
VEEEEEGENRTAGLDARKIKKIVFGDHTIDTWYAAPYPEEYTRSPKLNICDHCLSYLRTDYVAKRHKVRKHVFML